MKELSKMEFSTVVGGVNTTAPDQPWIDVIDAILEFFE